jgi:phosphotransferase system  glucose/maltose/N-acetylglucosamine-specific IIC component
MVIDFFDREILFLQIFFVNYKNLKNIFMPIIVPFPVYGLLFGIQYVSGDVDENFDLDDDVQMVQIALGFFGLSIMW